MIKISDYDSEADAMYVQITDGNVLDSEEIADGIIVDYDNNDNILGFELIEMEDITISSLKKLKSLLSPNTIAMLQEFNIFSHILCW